MLKFTWTVVFLVSCAVAVDCRAEDLAKHYATTLDSSGDRPVAYDWSCEDDDAWQLTSFEIRFGDKLKIRAEGSQVIFGKHDKGVLWAVVLPREPGVIVKASAGEGQQVTSVWLRFHPSRLNELFPESTVLNRAKQPAIAIAKRIAEHKMRSSYHAGGHPTLPPRHHLIVDCETVQADRRFYLIDSQKNAAQYVDSFRQRGLPIDQPMTAVAATEVFDKAWNAFDQKYAMFLQKPEVDWVKLRDEFRPQAARAQNDRELAIVLSKMLGELQDLHVYVELRKEVFPTHQRRRPLNANAAATESLIGKLTSVNRQIAWAIAGNNVSTNKIAASNIGYIRISGLSETNLVNDFHKALRKMNQTQALILDLRFNSGGNEELAQQMAGCFLDRTRVYAMSQYRSGPRHGDLGQKQTRDFSPSADLNYRKPVVVLQGQRTISSAEAFVLMMRQCPEVITMGDHTAGSSGNPIRVDCGSGIFVNVPRWNPLDADGKSFDTVGIQPDKLIEHPPDDFTASTDPVLTAALEHLRSL